MKRSTFAAVMLALALLFAAQARGKGIEFEHGALEAAKTKAREANKLLFIDVYADWCGPCKYMSANVFTEAEVGDYFNPRFVSIKLDVETEAGKAFAKSNDVKVLPTFFFLDPATGELLHRAIGGKETEAFLQMARVASDPEKRLSGYRIRFEANPKDQAAAYAYAAARAKAGLDGGEAAKAWLAQASDAELISRKGWDLAKESVQKVSDPLYVKMVRKRDRFKQVAESAEYVDNVITGVCRTDVWRLSRMPAEERAAKTEEMRRFVRENFGESTELMFAMIEYYEVQLAEDQPEDADAYAAAAAFMQYFDSAGPQNDAAWFIYKNCADADCLNGAYEWSKKCVEQNDHPSYLDTYMRLALAVGDYASAKTAGKKCLKAWKKEGNKRMAQETKAFLKEVKAAKKK